MSKESAHELYTQLKHGFGKATFNKYTDGELYAEEAVSNKRKRWMAFAGFDTYTLNQGDQDDNNGLRQKKCTTSIKGKDIPLLKSAFPALKTFIEAVLSYSSMEIAFIDILRQSSTGQFGGKESLFNWHRDNDGDRTKVRQTIIFLLTDTDTSMQVLGYDEMHYNGAGCGVAFVSNMWHRSMNAAPGTMKIAFFLTGKPRRTESKEWKQCICKQVNPPGKKKGWLVEDWFQCDNCDRWCHGVCARKHGVFEGENFLIHYNL